METDRLLILPIIVLIVLMAYQSASAATYRHFLLTQNDWESNKGFFLNLENDGPDGGTLSAGTMRLVFGVGDGKGWKVAACTPDWKPGMRYEVKAMVDKGRIELWLNGTLMAKAQGTLMPNPTQALAGGVPEWASGHSDYMVSQTLAEIVSNGRTVYSRTMDGYPTGPLALFGRLGAIRPIFEAGSATETPFGMRTVFTIIPLVNPKDAAPLVDRYGQVIHGDWPGKIKSDKDLKAALALERERLKAWGLPGNRDVFGGSTDLGWKVKGSGYYRLVMKNGMWWLVTPDGNPCFYTGICTAPSPSYPKTPVTGRESLFMELPPRDGADMWDMDQWGEGEGVEYAGFIPWNLSRKLGDDWKSSNEALTLQRIRAWGFSGIGKWGYMEGVPFVSVLQRGGVPNLAGHPDVFDPEVKGLFRETLETQILRHKYNPMLLGWSLGNEYGEIITAREVRAILGKEGVSPAKAAMLEHAVSKLFNGSLDALAKAWGLKETTFGDIVALGLAPPADAVGELRRFYADAYYAFIHSTVKSIDPRHLYLGFWIVPHWWEEEADWDLIAKHCDIIGYDRYAMNLMDEGMKARVARTKKPVLLGEFGFPAIYSGTRGFGTWGHSTVNDDAESGERYAALVGDAARHPMVVGTLWFEYRDEPVTGRGPGSGEGVVYGEHHAFGLVDGTDTPKWDLVERVRRANLDAPAIRARTKP